MESCGAVRKRTGDVVTLSQNCVKRLLASSRLFVRLVLSVRMEQPGSHWTDYQ